MNYSKYFPVREYYRKYIIPINPNRYRDTSDKMVCPVHDDHDPSLGIIHSKKDGEICHCFGCNFWGNIVELHQRVNRRLFKKYLSEEEAIKDLCRIFKIDYNTLPKEVSTKDLEKGLRQEIALNEALEGFDIGDFKQMIIEGKRNKKGITYFNTLMMIAINELKEVEEG